jgi:hypothetical protein
MLLNFVNYTGINMNEGKVYICGIRSVRSCSGSQVLVV